MYMISYRPQQNNRGQQLTTVSVTSENSTSDDLFADL